MTLFLLISFVFIAVVTLTLGIGAGIDDIRAVNRIRRHKSQASPLVTILFTVDGDVAATQNFLENVRQNSYQKLEIILMCTRAERAKLQKTITQFQDEYAINIFSGTPTFANAYRRYGHGAIILALASCHQLQRSAIDRALWHFDSQPNIAVLRPSVATTTRYSSVGLLQRYIAGIARLWRKTANTLLPSAPTSPLSPPTFYRRLVLAGPLQKDPLLRTYFADNVTIFTPAINSIRTLTEALYRSFAHNYTVLWQSRADHPLLAGYRHFFALCVGGLLLTLPIFATYTLSLAITARQPLLLFTGIGAAGLYVLFSIWTAVDLRRRQKLYLTALLPAYLPPLLLYSLFCTLALIALAIQHLRKTTPQLVANLKKPLLP